MDDTRRNTLVGAFMIVGLGALGWLMTAFGEMPAWLIGGEYEILMSVKGPSGIGDGAPIYLNGVQVGRVKELRFKNIKFPDAGVHVVGLIQEEYVIPNTAQATLQPAGLGLGRGYIDLEVLEGVHAPALQPGDEIPGTMGSPFRDMIPETLLDSVETTVIHFGRFIETLTPVAQDLHDILDQRTIEDVDHPIKARALTANLYTVIQRFDLALMNFNDVFGDPDVKAGWQEMFVNVKQMSIDGREALDNIQNTTAQLRTDLKRISDKLEGGIDDATASIDQIVGQALPVLQNVAALTADLSRILRALEEGQGTAGMLLKDPRVYESLLLTTQRMTELIDTFQRLANKFERDGAIGIKAQTPLGPIRKNFKIPDSTQ